MAEICKRCFGEVKAGEVLIMSEHKEICESCGKYYYTVDRIEKKGYISKLIEWIKEIGW